MKTLLVLLMTLSFNMGFAKDYVSYGSIHFQSAATWVPAQKVCQDGGYLFHKKKASIAVEYCDDRGDNCKVVYKKLKQKMNSTRQRCSFYQGGNCKKYITVPYIQGTTKAKVYSTQQDMTEDRNPIDRFDYTVDACNM